MKKFLSMVLALVMVMSLVTISAGAKDFTDAASINYKEATDVMSALEVIDGYADGSFGPSATLTRGAAAKIICNLLLGPKTAGALTADSAVFPDVPASHTFAGYIAYCAKEGIINGYEDGTFRPAGTLTGYAFLKMLLGALGYDAVNEGYVGASWTISVFKQADTIGLIDGNDDFVGTKAVTREEACQYALNTLTAELVEYENNNTVTVGNVVISNSSKAETKERKNETAGDHYKQGAPAEDRGTWQFCEKYFKDLKQTNATNDAFARPAKGWTYKNEDVGTYAQDGDLQTTLTGLVTKGDLFKAVGKSVADKIYDGKADEVTVDWYIDGKAAATIDAGLVLDENSFVDGSTAKVSAKWMGRGSKSYVYYNADDKLITVCTVEQYLYQANGDYSSTKKSVKADALFNENPKANIELKSEDFAVTGVKEDDYLIVTYSRKAGEVKSVEAARTVKGEVSTYRKESTVTISSTPYTWAGLANLADKQTAFTVGDTAVLVLDAENNILYVDEVSEVGNYIYIAKVATDGALDTSAVASAYFTDGTQKNITVKKYADKTDATWIKNNLDGNAWYTYSVDAEGKYTIKDALGDYTTDNTIVNAALNGAGKTILANKVAFANTNAFGIAQATAKANNSTVFIIRDNDDEISVYTGVSKVPAIETTAGAAIAAGDIVLRYLLDKDKIAKYVFLDYNAADKIGEDDGAAVSEYLFVMFKEGQLTADANDKVYYEGAALVNGSFKEIKIDEDAALNRGILYTKPSTNSDGYYKSAKAFSGADTFVALASAEDVSFDGGILDIAGESFVATNAKINLILTGGDANVLMDDQGNDYEYKTDISASELASDLSSKLYTYEYNVFVLRNDDGSETADTIYVYVYEAAEK